MMVQMGFYRWKTEHLPLGVGKIRCGHADLRPEVSSAKAAQTYPFGGVIRCSDRELSCTF